MMLGRTKKPRSSTSIAQVSAAVLALKATAAENLKSRERKLREDVMCIVLNPKRVRCRRCSIEISLSKKSDYDPCHWNKHRERCLKRKSNGASSDESRGGRPPSLTISECSERKIFNSQRQRAASLSSSTPSLSPDVDADNDYDVNVPLSPLTSISSGSPSPVSPVQPLARSPSPNHSCLELSKSGPSLTTLPKAKSAIPNLMNSPTPPPNPILPPLSDSTYINCPSPTLISKGSIPHRRLSHLELYNPLLQDGSPLEFPRTEYFRWSDLRTSFPDGSELLHGGSGSDSGNVTPTGTATMYTLSAAYFDQSRDEEEAYYSGPRFTTSSCRFSHSTQM